MKKFYLNGYLWHIKFVSHNSHYLIDRTGTYRLATTDPVTLTIYISKSLKYPLLNRVLIHELGHCAIISFDLTKDIHKFVKPEYWYEAEEWVCNFIADYGQTIFNEAYKILGNDALYSLPIEIEKLII